MTSFERELFNEAAADSGVALEELSEEKARQLHSRIVDKWFRDDRYLLWDSLIDPIAYRDPAAWRRLSDMIGNQQVIIFSEPKNEPAKFRCAGSEVTKFLGECGVSNVYLVDEDLTFLLAISDHDIIYGVGTARNWLKALYESGTTEEPPS